MTSVVELLEAQGRRLREEPAQRGGKSLEGSRLKRIGPASWVIPQAGERTHIRANP
jgi:hypothetical protein